MLTEKFCTRDEFIRKSSNNPTAKTSFHKEYFFQKVKRVVENLRKLF